MQCTNNDACQIIINITDPLIYYLKQSSNAAAYHTVDLDIFLSLAITPDTTVLQIGIAATYRTVFSSIKQHKAAR